MPIEQPGWGTYYLSGSISLGIWRKVGGVWNLYTTDFIWVSQDTGSSGIHTVGWSHFGTYNLGAGVTDFGVTIESHDGTGATISNLDVSYGVQAASGTRSATPSGETTRATVRP